jgi:hypothetical protein
MVAPATLPRPPLTEAGALSTLNCRYTGAGNPSGNRYSGKRYGWGCPERTKIEDPTKKPNLVRRDLIN